MNVLLGVEIFSVLTGLTYVILLMNENIWCWLFGAISSLFSIYLFFETQLYAEAILYFYYVVIAIYGWLSWSKKGEDFDIVKLSMRDLLKFLISAIIGSAALYYLFKNFTDAARPMVDSATTIFAFVATYLQAKKILSNWVWWMGINAVSVWLYYDRGLSIYAMLMALYFILSVIGWIQWKNRFQTQ